MFMFDYISGQNFANVKYKMFKLLFIFIALKNTNLMFSEPSSTRFLKSLINSNTF